MKLAIRSEDVLREEYKGQAIACIDNIKRIDKGFAEFDAYEKETIASGKTPKYVHTFTEYGGKGKKEIKIELFSKDVVLSILKRDAEDYAKQVRALCAKAQIDLDEDEESLLAKYEKSTKTK